MTMKAMILEQLANLSHNPAPLRLVTRSVPQPGRGELLVKVSVCAVCHTELDEIEGRMPPPSLPVIPGHQVVGRVADVGDNVTRHRTGDRVGAGWIHDACGACKQCRAGNDNLRVSFVATGRDVDGGYAEYLTVPERYAFPIPSEIPDNQAAPLLCAGAIGYRSLHLAQIENGDRLGLSGFGASGHLVLKTVRSYLPETDVFVFARNPRQREFALKLGAVWSGDIGDTSPAPLHAIIDTTPAWKPVVEALGNLAPGGRLVINAIRKDDVDRAYLLKLDYARDLWHEKEIKSVANVSGGDIEAFLHLAATYPAIRPDVEQVDLAQANEALLALKTGGGTGARVLRVASE